MNRWVYILLFAGLLIGMLIAAWAWEQRIFTVADGLDLRPLAIGISVVALTLAAGMFVWRLTHRPK